MSTADQLSDSPVDKLGAPELIVSNGVVAFDAGYADVERHLTKLENQVKGRLNDPDEAIRGVTQVLQQLKIQGKTALALQVGFYFGPVIVPHAPSLHTVSTPVEQILNRVKFVQGMVREFGDLPIYFHKSGSKFYQHVPELTAKGYSGMVEPQIGLESFGNGREAAHEAIKASIGSGISLHGQTFAHYELFAVLFAK